MGKGRSYNHDSQKKKRDRGDRMQQVFSIIFRELLQGRKYWGSLHQDQGRIKRPGTSKGVYRRSKKRERNPESREVLHLGQRGKTQSQYFGREICREKEGKFGKKGFRAKGSETRNSKPKVRKTNGDENRRVPSFTRKKSSPAKTFVGKRGGYPKKKRGGTSRMCSEGSGCARGSRKEGGKGEYV